MPNAVLTFLLLQIQEYKVDVCKQGWGLMGAIKFMSVRNDRASLIGSNNFLHANTFKKPSERFLNRKWDNLVF